MFIDNIIKSKLYQTNSDIEPSKPSIPTNMPIEKKPSKQTDKMLEFKPVDSVQSLKKSKQVFDVDPPFLPANNTFPSISSMQVDEAFYDITNDDEVIEFNHATVCLIDICGFSNWCSNQIPASIVHTMSKFNLFLTKELDKYNSLTKIELVGDCCMIVSGLFDVIKKDESTLELIRFAVSVLRDMKQIHNIFMDTSIGLRIGIHLSNVFGIMMSNPRRFQLYGNDINVCSRLESSAVKNTIHISYKTIMTTQGLCSAICGPLCIRSTMLNNPYKGVGDQKSFMFFVKIDEIIWYHTVSMKLKSILKNFNEFSHSTIINECPFEQLKSFFWDHFVIFIESLDALNRFTEKVYTFRVWEIKRMSQNITFVITEDLYTEYKHRLDTSLYNIVRFDSDEEEMNSTLKHIIKSERNIDKSSSSIDLQTCT